MGISYYKTSFASPHKKNYRIKHNEKKKLLNCNGLISNQPKPTHQKKQTNK